MPLRWIDIISDSLHSISYVSLILFILVCNIALGSDGDPDSFDGSLCNSGLSDLSCSASHADAELLYDLNVTQNKSHILPHRRKAEYTLPSKFPQKAGTDTKLCPLFQQD